MSGVEVNATTTQTVEIGGWNIGADVLAQLQLAIVGVNAVGVVANTLLLTGLLLLHGTGRMSIVSVQMIAQQATAELLSCSVAIAYTFDRLSWPQAGTAPDWLRAFICFAWHSQGVYFVLFPLSVYNNVMLAAERLVALAFPFYATRMARKRFRVALLCGWLTFVVSYSWVHFIVVVFDPVNGCQSPDFFAISPIIRWYAFGWTMMAYPVPLFFAIVFNAAAVLSLHRQSRSLRTSGDERLRENSGGSGSDTVLKRRAADGLQRASIALAATFAITAGPLQIVTEIQSFEGTYWGVGDIRNVIAVGVSALHFVADPILCLIFLSGIRRALFSFCSSGNRHLLRKTSMAIASNT